jgi:hypothetical protein
MIEKICKNCRLFNEKENVCGVTVVVRGEHYELPVLPFDECHWEKVDAEIQQELEHKLSKETRAFFQSKLTYELDKPIEIQQVRMWSDGENGYVEYPT